jgi:hypothetical protein
VKAYGLGIPSELRDWLEDSSTGKTKRFEDTYVALGPHDSFVAWDSESMRWSGIPATLEEQFQEWLSPAGWIHGPPKLVSLGINGSWFAVTEDGSWATLGIPNTMIEAVRKVKGKIAVNPRAPH